MMALFLSRLRQNTTLRRSLRHFASNQNPNSILNPNSTTPLTSEEKTRAAISLIKLEKNPERIITICRAAALTPEVHLDRVAFSVAIYRLRDLHYFSGVRSFLEELKSRYDLKTERYMCHAMILYAQADMLNDAIRTFKEMDDLGVPRSVESLNALLFSCVIAKQYSEVRRVFTVFPGSYGLLPNLDTYNTVIKAYCESGESSSVYSVLHEMGSKGIKPNATSYAHALAGFYKEEKFEDVEKILEMMKNQGLKTGRVSTYNVRILSLCKLRRSSDAKALLDSMISRGTKPNTVTYGHLIHGFGREGNLEEAKRMFNEMRKKGCKPDSFCYFSLVHSLCEGGDFETALEISKDCMAKGWFPKFTIMKSLVDGLVRISKVEEAREIVSKVRNKFSENADIWKEIEGSLPQ